MFTKHYILLAEELDLEGNTLIQPLKEHRDAYDHIIRVYSAKLGMNKSADEDYILTNMSKALGHEYRAFFDTADWISLVIRENINFKLKYMDREKLIKCYPNYPQFKSMLLSLPDEIVKLREGKDIGKASSSYYDIVEKYAGLLDKLYFYYKEFSAAIDNLQ